ncbi:RNase A-like domain-containing protein [Streptomyces sp. NPDC046712]|uniref:RNase A-like domain-containing protein n=1 Tax=Streptomyces sp. NPDC046712 TaxID=3154802 RepID=UPI0033D87D97
MGTPPPSPSPQNGTIDVKPSHLFTVSGQFAKEQTDLHKAATTLLNELGEYQDAGGYGTSAQAFSAAYMKVGNRFLEVWARSVVSIGGAAVGFTTTANNYVKADAASDPTGNTQAHTQPPPQVIDKAPVYPRVTDLKWGDDDGGDRIWVRILEWVPDPIMDAIRVAIKHAYRMGRVPDVYPFPDQHHLNSLSGAWGHANRSLFITVGNMSGHMAPITNQANSEWHDAMRTFLSSLWGTTAWGKSTAGYEWKHDTASSSAGATNPVFAVLSDTSRKISDLLREFGEAAVELNAKVYDEYWDAVKKAVADVNLKDGIDFKDVKGLIKGIGKGVATVGLNIPLNIDTSAMNAIVNRYESTVDGLTRQFDALMPALDEAFMSAPSFHAEDARAQSFGARALHEFKPEHTYRVPGEDPKNHFFPIDLASQEGLEGSHPVDKHVGKTDEQLAQRLRDQQTVRPDGVVAPRAISTFTDHASAQRLTQEVLDDITHADRIEKWIAKQEDPATYNPNSKPSYSLTFNEVTGRSLSRADYDADGFQAQAKDVHSVKVTLKYIGNHTDPPFIVLTSMPEGP